MQSIDVNRNSIKRARELRGWSQGDVAEKLGCDARSVGRWERGVVSPSAYYRQKLCLLFEQNMEELGLLEEEPVKDIQKPVSLEQEAVYAQPEQNREEAKLIEEVRDGSIFRPIPVRMFIELFLLLMLIVGSIGAFSAVYSIHSIKILAGAALVGSTPVGKVPASTVAVNTTPVGVTPVSTIPYGKLLYTTTAPGSKCDFGGGQWEDYNRPDIQCLATQAVMSNPSVTAPDLRGTILTGIPGATYPDNYVLEAQVQQPATAADFGLYFRNQPGDQQGVYTFFVHPNGAWGAYAYDNITAAQTLIASGTAFIDPHAQLYLTVVAIGPEFTFYINRQKVGMVHNATYGTGTVGIAVDAGGTIIVNDVSLYSMAQH